MSPFRVCYWVKRAIWKQQQLVYCREKPRMHTGSYIARQEKVNKTVLENGKKTFSREFITIPFVSDASFIRMFSYFLFSKEFSADLCSTWTKTRPTSIKNRVKCRVKCRRVPYAGEIKLIFTRIWFASHVKQILEQAIGLKGQKAWPLGLLSSRGR